MEFRPVQFDDDTLVSYVDLLTQCFPKAPTFTLKYLHWLYVKNPEGMAVGFDAWDGHKLVGHYVCIPCKVQFAEALEGRALLSLNSITHPNYQGKGIFTKLAQLTFTSGSKAGFHCVYGVANSNSTNAFVLKLGFQLVQPLDAHFGLGSAGADWCAAVSKTQFARKWTPASLAWRVACPRNPIGIAHSGGITIFQAAAGAYVNAYAEIKLPSQGMRSPPQDTRWKSPLRVCLGLMPIGTARYPGYFNLPERLRPSPLNFIYLGLNGGPRNLAPGSLQITFLDFDAF